MGLDFTCDQAYRNGSRMAEEPTEPHVYDTVDWFKRAARDPRVVANQLRDMRSPIQLEEDQ